MAAFRDIFYRDRHQRVQEVIAGLDQIEICDIRIVYLLPLSLHILLF